MIEEKIIGISENITHALVLTEDGKVYAKGWNNLGELGLGLNLKGKPDKVDNFQLINDLNEIKAVSTNFGRSADLNRQGKVFVWGNNNWGMAGKAYPKVIDRPYEIPGLKNMVQVSLGGAFVLVLDNKGTVWSWGNNDDGQLGRYKTIEDELNENDFLTARKVFIEEEVVQIIARDTICLALTKKGEIYEWGRYQWDKRLSGINQLKIQGNEKELRRTIVITAGREHFLALTEEGEVFSWGRGTTGRPGDSFEKMQANPVKILENIKAISCGEYFGAALGKEDKVYIWGSRFSKKPKQVKIEQRIIPLLFNPGFQYSLHPGKIESIIRGQIADSIAL